MKKAIIFTSILFAVIAFQSCNGDPRYEDPGFEGMIQMTIYDYIISDEDERFSNFLRILEKAGIDKTLSAYNPRGLGYTLFLPDNDAILRFINNHPQFNSLDELLNEPGYAEMLGKYHVLNLSVHTNDFPFGAFPEPTLSEDLLTVSFLIDTETDNSYYMINNQSAVIEANIEASNGYIHEIEQVLNPIAFTTYQWIELHEGYSIFKDAVDLTGFDEIININIKEVTGARPFTLLLEHDSIYQKSGIMSVDDLISRVSPSNDDYKSPLNPLYNYVGYHMVAGNYFIDDLVGPSTNYSTYAEVPLHIDGRGHDILINRGRSIFEVIIKGVDTTIIDWIGFHYDASNVLTQSGVIHFVDRMLEPVAPIRAILNFEFWEESNFNQYRNKLGEFKIEDESALSVVKFSGDDLYYVKRGQGETNAWSLDYLMINGDFSISYTVPKIVQGRYRVLLRANRFNQENAVVEVFIDGVKIGGLMDLSTGGNANNPFQTSLVGTIEFTRYDNHVVTVTALIPGNFQWDVIRFEPY
jgi:uncharacterized surface protein with fasciclin (FAS1) repeats